MLAVLLARVNDRGALESTTRTAADAIAAAGGPEPYVSELAKTSRDRTGDFRERLARFQRTGIGEAEFFRENMPPVNRGALPYLTVDERLALEMSVNEEAERRALEEEIAPLEVAWREAEEIAAIADNLLTPVPRA